MLTEPPFWRSGGVEATCVLSAHIGNSCDAGPGPGLTDRADELSG